MGCERLHIVQWTVNFCLHKVTNQVKLCIISFKKALLTVLLDCHSYIEGAN